MGTEAAAEIEQQFSNLAQRINNGTPCKTAAEWNAFLDGLSRDQAAFNAALQRDAATAKTAREARYAAAKAALPQCAMFQGSARRCSACRVHRNVHA